MSRLWYKQPASIWEEALPLGNGRMGAMVFGGEYIDRIQISEDTLWSGYPSDDVNEDALNHLEEARKLISRRKYYEAYEVCNQKMLHKEGASYLTYGTLFIELNEGQVIKYKRKDICSFNQYDRSKYVRELDLETAVVKETFVVDGITFTKEIFTSYVDDVIAIKITSSVKSTLNLKAYIGCDLESSVKMANDNTLDVYGRCPTYSEHRADVERLKYEEDKESVKFYSRLYAECIDGNVQAGGGAITVSEATSAVLYFNVSTSFNGFNVMPISGGRDCRKNAIETIDNARKYSFDELKERHIKDYQKLFKRVELNLGKEKDLPTDKRIKRIKAGKKDTSFFALLFDYGRYLTISASRPGSQPINLQGIWNKEIFPPWKSNYTLNINAQMNYWPTEVCNLSECHMPFIEMAADLAIQGEKVAKTHFGIEEGWVVCHNTDLWRKCTPVDGDAKWAYWMMGAPWLCRHIWEHYLFTNDIDFLKERFYIIESAAKAMLGWLVTDDEGYLTTSPSSSPENTFMFNGKETSICSGSASDLLLIDDLFKFTIKACEILGDKEEFIKELQKALAKLKPLQIGSDGRLLEWNEEFEEKSKGFTYLAHLYGIYPADTMTKESPFYEAARKSFDYRIEHGTGGSKWPCGWVLCLLARYGETKLMDKYLYIAAKHLWLNMFNAHPPFQIDANLGVTAGIAECLVQSHNGEIKLLPALPESWKNGYVKGLKVRGGKTVDITWKNGKITDSRIY